MANVNGNDARTSEIVFDFLEPGKTYIATIYADHKNAHYRQNPQAYTITQVSLTHRSKLKQLSAPGGGYAIHIKEASKDDIKGPEEIVSFQNGQSASTQ